MHQKSGLELFFLHLRNAVACIVEPFARNDGTIFCIPMSGFQSAGMSFRKIITILPSGLNARITAGCGIPVCKTSCGFTASRTGTHKVRRRIRIRNLRFIRRRKQNSAKFLRRTNLRMFCFHCQNRERIRNGNVCCCGESQQQISGGS